MTAKPLTPEEIIRRIQPLAMGPDSAWRGAVEILESYMRDVRAEGYQEGQKNTPPSTVQADETTGWV